MTIFGSIFEDGQVLNERWIILELIGSGGMGEIYKAHDKRLDRTVAIKVISQKRLAEICTNKYEYMSSLERFRREATVMADISHPNVIDVFDTGITTITKNKKHVEVDYIVMEYMPGGTLRDTMLEEGFEPDDDRTSQWLSDYYVPLLDVVASIHESGVVHRDLKPENIFLGHKIFKLGDFGICRSNRHKSVTQTIDIKGTPPYMPQEQFIDMKRVDNRADIYALGKILYEAISGRISDTEIPHQVARLKNPSTPFLKHLDHIIQHATAVDRNNRISSVEHLKQTLQRLITKTAKGIDDPFMIEAHSIYVHMSCNITRLHSNFNYLKPPPVERLHRRTANEKIVATKDWSRQYDDLRSWRFIVSIYKNALRTPGADALRASKHKHLYVFDDEPSPYDKPLYGETVGTYKPKEIFTPPGIRSFQDTLVYKFFANYDDSNTIAFAAYLASLAHDNRKLSMTDTPSNHFMTIKRLSRIYCLGEQGIGKTTFLNYLFSTRSKYFYQHKCIWIRLDFNAKRMRTQNLDRAILNQFVLIFVKYYLRSRHTPIQIKWSALHKHMPTQALKDEIDTLKNFITQKAATKQLSERFIYALINFLHKEGFGVIFIIDGMDKLSLESNDIDSTSRLIDQLEATFYNDEYINAVFVLSVRHITYSHLRSIFEDKTNHEHFKMFILPKNLETIVSRKLEHARKMVLHIVDRMKCKNSSNIDIGAITEGTLREFERQIINITFKGLCINEANGDYSPYVQLRKICGNNLRAMFRCIENVVAYFGWIILDHIYARGLIDAVKLENALEKKKYYVVRAYMMGDDVRKSYLNNYTYNIDSGRIHYRLQADRKGLIPNIFNYIDERVGAGPLSSKQIRILLRIRCIDYAIYKEGKVSLLELVDMLNDVFKYDKLFSIAEIYEMESERLLVPADLYMPVRPDYLSEFIKEARLESTNDVRFVLTDLAKYIYEVMITQFTYLASIVNDIPVPVEIYKKMHPTNYFWKNTSMNDYLVKSICNVLIFMWYLYSVEHSENMHIKEWTKSQTDNSQIDLYKEYLDQKDKIFRRISLSIKDEIKRIIVERLKNAPQFKQNLKSLWPGMDIKDSI